MNAFQISALTTAFIIMIVLIIIIALILLKSKGKGSIHADSCPDYWTTSNYANAKDSVCEGEFGCCSDYATSKTDVDGTNCPIKCYNSKNLGKTSANCTSIPTEMDFGSDTYTGSNGLCNKQTWAKQCGITWDGVTNVPFAC